MTMETVLVKLVWLGSKDDPNLYIGWRGGKDGRPQFPALNVRIEPGIDKQFLKELWKTLGGYYTEGYNGFKIPPVWRIEREEAFNLLYPYDQLVWPLERAGTKNGKIKADIARDVVAACIRQNKVYD